MPYFRERPLILWSFPCLVFLSGCNVRPECDSVEVRNAVLQIVSDDHNNPLAAYAAKNSTAKSTDLENEKPLYALDETIATISASWDRRTIKCSGSLSVTVGDASASKELDFTVQQASDGKLSVAVAPFQF